MGVGAQTSGQPGTDTVTLTRSDAAGSSVTKTLTMKGKAVPCFLLILSREG